MGSNFFQLISPCFFITQDNYYRGELTLSINTKEANLLLSSERKKIPIITISSGILKLVDELTLKFNFNLPKKFEVPIIAFRNKNEISRFFHALVDSALLSPINHTDYQLFSVPLNLPSHIFDDQSCSLFKSCKNRIKEKLITLAINCTDKTIHITNPYFRFLKDRSKKRNENTIFYIDSVTIMIQYHLLNISRQWLFHNQKFMISQKNITCLSILNYIYNNVHVEKGIVRKLINNITENQYDEEILHDIQFIQHPLFTGPLVDLCKIVMDAYIASGQNYMSKEIVIIVQIAILFYGVSGISNDKTSPPNWAKYVLVHPQFVDYVYAIFNAVTDIFSYFSRDNTTVAVNMLSHSSLLLIQQVAPELIPFFYAHKILFFGWLENDYPNLYAGLFADVWKLWYWLLTCPRPQDAFIAFITSLIIFELRIFSEEKVFGGIDDLYPLEESIHNLVLGDVLDYANYLLTISEKD